jgi:hypothetical protein
LSGAKAESDIKITQFRVTSEEPKAGQIIVKLQNMSPRILCLGLLRLDVLFADGSDASPVFARLESLEFPFLVDTYYAYVLPPGAELEIHYNYTIFRKMSDSSWLGGDLAGIERAKAKLTTKMNLQTYQFEAVTSYYECADLLEAQGLIVDKVSRVNFNTLAALNNKVLRFRTGNIVIP